MKKNILILIMLNIFQHFSVQSQNLVPNYSFEIDTACPNNINQIYYSRPWFQPSIYSGNTVNSSTTDLFNACNGAFIGVPSNQNGIQNAKTGVGYAGICTYLDTTNYREYLEVPLLDSLVVGRSYCVQYYVSLANNYGTAISNMGAYLSVDSLLDNSFYHAIDNITPQIENPIGNMLSNTVNWMLVSGSFTAVGGEKFMTIGNFHNTINTNFQLVNSSAGSPNGAYYYIDDVSVLDCTNVGVQEVDDVNSVNIYPNPVTSVFNVSARHSYIKQIKIFNTLGQEIKTITSTETVDITNLSKGIYIAEIKTEKATVRKKIIKQ